MNRDDIIRMAREAGWQYADGDDGYNPLWRFAALVAAAEREKVAQWMIQHSYATGHGETTEDLLTELDWQIAENWNRAMINGVETEREACALILENCVDLSGLRDHPKIQHIIAMTLVELAKGIRARGQDV